MPKRHVLGELIFRNALLHLVFPALNSADVAVDDAAMIFLADEFVALRVADGVLHLHAFKRLDDALDVLACLVARSLDRLLNCEDVFPSLPAMALVHHALAAYLACMHVVDAD